MADLSLCVSANMSPCIPADPKHIQFLLSPELKYKFHFIVGNEEVGTVEKIGVVKKMLAAYSDVFRAQLESRWSSETSQHITDILPATFKNLLKYIYGYDHTNILSFEDADDLLYVADKYLMSELMEKVARRLISLLDYSNICSLMVNPACQRVMRLNSEISKILQSETNKVFETPQFLSCSPDVFVKILEQEKLNVSELEVWRAALAWAKKRVTSDDSKSLRLHLQKPLLHIRICTIPPKKFCAEVLSTGILSRDEEVAVREAQGTCQKPRFLPAICTNNKVRKIDMTNYRRAENETIIMLERDYFVAKSKEASFFIETGYRAVDITGLVFVLKSGIDFADMTVKLKQEGSTEWVICPFHEDPTRNLHEDPTWSVWLKRIALYNACLSPHSRYVMTLSSVDRFTVCTLMSNVRSRDLTLEFTEPGSPVIDICYRILTL